MTEQDVQDWLDEYGRAWVDGDPDRAVALFSDTATYREVPFDDPMRGRHAIREYWRENAASTSRARGPSRPHGRTPPRARVVHRRTPPTIIFRDKGVLARVVLAGSAARRETARWDRSSGR